MSLGQKKQFFFSFQLAFDPHTTRSIFCFSMASLVAPLVLVRSSSSSPSFFFFCIAFDEAVFEGRHQHACDRVPRREAKEEKKLFVRKKRTSKEITTIFEKKKRTHVFFFFPSPPPVLFFPNRLLHARARAHSRIP